MDKEKLGKFTGLIEAFVRSSNKYQSLQNRPHDYGTGDLLYPSEIHLLNTIYKSEYNNIKEIADYLGITKSAASQTVMKLEKKSLCKKYKAENKKNIQLRLTSKGELAVISFLEHKNRIFSDLMPLVEKSDLYDLEIAEKLFTNLENYFDRMNNK